MNGNFLTSEDEGHIDLLVARHFPDGSDIGSIGELCAGDAAVHRSGQSPRIESVL